MSFVPPYDCGDGVDEDVFISHTTLPLHSLLHVADATLEQKEGLVTLEALLRAARSTGPKEILIKLAVNRHLLHMQLAAVRIQSRIRRYLAIQRVRRIRRRFHLFQRITLGLSERLVEEVVLASCMELNMQIILTHERYLQHKQLVGYLLIEEVDVIVQEVVESMAGEVVVEIVEQAADKILQNRPKPVIDELRESRNPLIRIMLAMVDAEVDRMVRPVVVEAILEEVDDYLLRTHGDYIYGHIAKDVVDMLVLDTLFNLFLNDPDLSSSPVASSLASELWDTIEQLQGIEKKPTLVITPPDEEESLEDKQKHEEQIRGEAKQWIDFVLKTACEKVLGILP